MKAKEVARKARLRKKKANVAKKAKAKAKAALRAKLEALPCVFSAKDVDAPKGDGLRARIRCLERIKLRSPELTFEQDADWIRVRDAFASNYGNTVKLADPKHWGNAFLEEIKTLVRALGSHYQGGGGKKDLKGDEQAFAKFYNRMSARIPKPANSVVL